VPKSVTRLRPAVSVRATKLVYVYPTYAGLMSKMKISLRIPKDLVERANVAAKITQKSRGEIVTEALRGHLAELEDEEAFKEDVFDLYLDGQISLGTLNQFLGSEDAESVHISKTLLDQGQGSSDESAPEE